MFFRKSQNCIIDQRKKKCAKKGDWNQRWDLWSTKAHYDHIVPLVCSRNEIAIFIRPSFIAVSGGQKKDREKKCPRKKVNIDQKIIMIWCRSPMCTNKIASQKQNCWGLLTQISEHFFSSPDLGNGLKATDAMLWFFVKFGVHWDAIICQSWDDAVLRQWKRVFAGRDWVWWDLQRLRVIKLL